MLQSGDSGAISFLRFLWHFWHLLSNFEHAAFVRGLGGAPVFRAEV